MNRPTRTAESLSGMDHDQSMPQQRAGSPPFDPYLPSDIPAIERHCEAEEPLVSPRAWWVFAAVLALAGTALIMGWWYERV